MTDTRFVYGARCAWFGPISAVGTTRGGRIGIPCCPHCGSVLYEMDDEATWWAGVDKFEANGHPGYRKFVEWCADKHFMSSSDGVVAYQSETGIEISIK